MRAARLTTEGSFAVDAGAPDPVPGPRELVLRVTGCGICGSDLKARPAMPAATVMGHEFCGEVVAVGTDLRSAWREGMRAAALPVFSCGVCEHCRRGDVAHCASAQLIGLGGAPGGFAELVRVDADLSFRLPDALPESWAPLVEPFAVGLHTARIAEITPADDVLVIGAGPVGLTTARWVRELGAHRVTVSDPAPRRRSARPHAQHGSLALARGARLVRTLNMAPSRSPGGLGSSARSTWLPRARPGGSARPHAEPG